MGLAVRTALAAAILSALVAPRMSLGQVATRLPPVSESFSSATPQTAAQPALASSYLGNPALDPAGIPPGEPAFAPSAPTVRQAGRDGFFQRFSVTGAWIAPADSNDLEEIDLETYATFAMPFPTRDAPLLISPVFGAHLLDGPTGVELPGTLYDAYLELRHLRPISDRLMLNVSVSPGVYSDFEEDASKAFRMPAQMLAIYDWSPTSQFVLGALYLDRSDVNWLPAGGWIWTPNCDFKAELIFPKPKVSWVLSRGRETECWGYVAGEFGGDAYTFVRSDGVVDGVILRDYRFILGLEQRPLCDGISSRIEAGYIFGRKIEYDSGAPTVKLSDTFMLRTGMVY